VDPLVKVIAVVVFGDEDNQVAAVQLRLHKKANQANQRGGKSSAQKGNTNKNKSEGEKATISPLAAARAASDMQGSLTPWRESLFVWESCFHLTGLNANATRHLIHLQDWESLSGMH
jgi:hypothetical protein